ncbi:MAG TPA: PilZ domain-containing protein [Devosia sp.]|nr:PilZ domain-containing protein [Devosia sp.]
MELEPSESVKIDTSTLRRRLQADESKNSHKRRFERHSIFAIAHITLTDSSQRIDGVVDEVSIGGIRFHPALSFIMERNNEPVTVDLGDLHLSGRIRATRADGYGIQLMDMLSEQQLADLLASYKTDA